MHLVDSQIHIWEAPRTDRPWPSERQIYHHGPASVSAEDILAQMDSAGVSGAILIPPSFEGDRNDLVVDAVTRHPDRFRALGRVALEAADAPAQLAALTDAWQLLGIRVTFAGPTRGWLQDGTLDWFWPLAAERQIPVSIFPFGQLEAVEPIVRSHPKLKLSIDHLSLSHREVRDETIWPVIEQLVRLARYPNVAVKATCLPSYVSESYPFPTLKRVLERVLDAFGARRVFWGSDLTRLPCSYRQLIDFFGEALTELSQRDVELVMGGAVMDWFGWHAQPQPQHEPVNPVEK